MGRSHARTHAQKKKKKEAPFKRQERNVRSLSACSADTPPPTRLTKSEMSRACYCAAWPSTQPPPPSAYLEDAPPGLNLARHLRPAWRRERLANVQKKKKKRDDKIAKRRERDAHAANRNTREKAVARGEGEGGASVMPKCQPRDAPLSSRSSARRGR